MFRINTVRCLPTNVRCQHRDSLKVHSVAPRTYKLCYTPNLILLQFFCLNFLHEQQRQFNQYQSQLSSVCSKHAVAILITQCCALLYFLQTVFAYCNSLLYFIFLNSPFFHFYKPGKVILIYKHMCRSEVMVGVTVHFCFVSFLLVSCEQWALSSKPNC